jgi:hypothetical protein
MNAIRAAMKRHPGEKGDRHGVPLAHCAVLRQAYGGLRRIDMARHGVARGAF